MHRITALSVVLAIGLCAHAPMAAAAMSMTAAKQLAAEAGHGDARALAELQARAGAGDAVAQKAMGDLYRHGQGVRRDDAAAAAWYRKAAVQGLAAAQGLVDAGWVAVAAYSSRCVYSGVVEHSGYVDPGARGRGVGRRLLDALIASTEAAGIWTIQSGIFPENTASIALHTSAGFRIVGTRERIGQQHGRWRDILLLERRSPVL